VAHIADDQKAVTPLQLEIGEPFVGGYAAHAIQLLRRCGERIGARRVPMRSNLPETFEAGVPSLVSGPPRRAVRIVVGFGI
jgi:hypothetical protein